MKQFTAVMALFLLVLVVAGSGAKAPVVPQWRDLFNGKNLKGWVNVNTDPDTWTVKGGEIVCKGKPIGVLRTDRQYENFILHVEWMHKEPGGNSGVFAWSNAVPGEKNRLPNGVEVQMLDLAYPELHKRNGVMPDMAYVSGELFGVGGVKTVPDYPRMQGQRSSSPEMRCKPHNEWNVYDGVFVDGTIKLCINGKFVNGISKCTQKKGYLCLESEGSPIHFRNIKIIELAPGITSAEQSAPELK